MHFFFSGPIYIFIHFHVVSHPPWCLRNMKKYNHVTTVDARTCSYICRTINVRTGRGICVCVKHVWVLLGGGAEVGEYVSEGLGTTGERMQARWKVIKVVIIGLQLWKVFQKLAKQQSNTVGATRLLSDNSVTQPPSFCVWVMTTAEVVFTASSHRK